MLVRAFERIRLRTASATVASVAAALQDAVMPARLRAALTGKDGTRRPYLPVDLACGPVFTFSPDDTLICAGYGWQHSNIRVIRDQRHVGPTAPMPQMPLIRPWTGIRFGG